MPDQIETRLRDLAMVGARAGRVPPAEAVRRRGTRRAQRQLVAVSFVVVAAVIVAVGGTALALRPSGSRPPAGPPDAPSTTPSPQITAPTPSTSGPPVTPTPTPTARPLPTDVPAGTITVIPASVTVLFEDHEVTRPEDGESLAVDETIGRPWTFNPCAWPVHQTDNLRTDMRTVDFSPQFENFQTHQLALYPNETVAAAVLEDFRAAVATCPPGPDSAGRAQEWRVAGLSVGDESFALINCCTGDIHATAYTAVRQGNAVYLGLLSTEGGIETLPEVEVWAGEMATRLCSFTSSC